MVPERQPCAWLARHVEEQRHTCQPHSVSCPCHKGRQHLDQAEVITSMIVMCSHPMRVRASHPRWRQEGVVSASHSAGKCVSLLADVHTYHFGLTVKFSRCQPLLAAAALRHGQPAGYHSTCSLPVLSVLGLTVEVTLPRQCLAELMSLNTRCVDNPSASAVVRTPECKCWCCKRCTFMRPLLTESVCCPSTECCPVKAG